MLVSNKMVYNFTMHKPITRPKSMMKLLPLSTKTGCCVNVFVRGNSGYVGRKFWQPLLLAAFYWNPQKITI